MSIATVIVGLVVLGAVLYFVRHIRGLFKGTASCCGESGCSGSCSSCHPSPKKADKTPASRANTK